MGIKKMTRQSERDDRKKGSRDEGEKKRKSLPPLIGCSSVCVQPLGFEILSL